CSCSTLHVTCCSPFVVTLRHPPRFALFPYTTLFRSRLGGLQGRKHGGKGGKATAERYGSEFYIRIGRLGGLTRARRVSESRTMTDRKSTRLNSSHGSISYAVFCLKKKIKDRQPNIKH